MSVQLMDYSANQASNYDKFVLVDKERAELSDEEFAIIEKYCVQKCIHFFGVDNLDLSCLNDWQHLESIYMNGCRVKRTDGVLRMESLKKIMFVGDSRRIPNLDFLEGLSIPQTLKVLQVPFLRQLPQFQNPVSLKVLEIKKCKWFDDVDSVLQFQNLDSLVLLNCNFTPAGLSQILGGLSLSEALVAVPKRSEHQELQAVLEEHGYEHFPSGKRKTTD